MDALAPAVMYCETTQSLAPLLSPPTGWKKLRASSTFTIGLPVSPSRLEHRQKRLGPPIAFHERCRRIQLPMMSTSSPLHPK